MSEPVIYFNCDECATLHVVPRSFAESCWSGEPIESYEQVGTFMAKVLARWHTEHPEERRGQN